MRIALKEDKSSPALWFNQVAKSGTLDENGEITTIDLIDKAEGEKTSSSNSNARKAVEQQVPGDDDGDDGAGDDDGDDGDGDDDGDDGAGDDDNDDTVS